MAVETIALVPLHGRVVFAGQVVAMTITDELAKATILEAQASATLILASPNLDGTARDVRDPARIAMAAELLQRIQGARGELDILVAGSHRVRIGSVTVGSTCRAEAERIDEPAVDAAIAGALVTRARTALRVLDRHRPLVPGVLDAILATSDPSALADRLAAAVPLSLADALDLIALVDPASRLVRACQLIEAAASSAGEARTGRAKIRRDRRSGEPRIQLRPAADPGVGVHVLAEIFPDLPAPSAWITDAMALEPALELWRELRADAPGFTPLLVPSMMLDHFAELEDERTAMSRDERADVAAAIESTTAAEVLADRRRQLGEPSSEVDLTRARRGIGKALPSGLPPMVHLVLFRGEPRDLPIDLVLDWKNAMPDYHEHAVIWADWGVRYGAAPLYAYADTLVLAIARPPESDQACVAASRERALYCPSDSSADGIASGFWFLWWD